ncbi:MAG: hypothetical protein FJ088_14855, partial [Deltaproteobacteria bacterium]|nr:hypothetical protein [Deltaproteobacteria bacterium]
QYFFDSFEECEKVCELSSACPVPFDYKYATAADINKNPAGYNGAPVYLTGDVKVGPAMCTLMACSPENPCCNSCGASMEIYDGSGMIELNSGGIGQVGCGGNECTYMNNCKPFSPDPGFLIWGKIQVYYNYPYLNVDGYCKK